MTDDGYRPTAQLRWRKTSWVNHRGEEKWEQTLQQLWESTEIWEDGAPGPNQWRDVPTEES